MLAQKIEKVKLDTDDFQKNITSKQAHLEDFIENMTEWMFRIILFVGIPYFLFVFIQFLRMS